MAITDLSTLSASLAAKVGRPFTKLSATAEGAGTFHSLWAVTGYPPAGSAPGATALVPTNATTGAWPFTAGGGALQDYIGNVNFRGPTAGTIIVYDRLVHVSGLSGTNVTVDTAVSNTALTRYTDGIGVEAYAEFYTAIGATAATLNVRYTDQDGNTNQVGTYAHPANAESVGQMVPIVLAAGDYGVRAITNYHWSVTTGTAGNFGFTLLRRLFDVPINANLATTMSALDHGLTQVLPDACIAFMVQCSTTSTGLIQGNFSTMSQ